MTCFDQTFGGTSWSLPVNGSLRLLCKNLHLVVEQRAVVGGPDERVDRSGVPQRPRIHHNLQNDHRLQRGERHDRYDSAVCVCVCTRLCLFRKWRYLLKD